jgi:hypothetical protein
MTDAKLLELEVEKIQREILAECLEIFTNQDDEFLVFVHVRNIAFIETGRNTIFGSNVECRSNDIARYLSIQHEIDPSLRTYNELIVCDQKCGENLGACFSFGDDTDGGIHFRNDQIQDAIGDYSFDSIADQIPLRELRFSRLSIGINKEIGDKFNIELLDKKNLFLSVAEEIRYSIQILMLWSKTMNWKYIETHHSKSSFDSLSSLVITVCSPHRKLKQQESQKIHDIITRRELNLVRKMASKRDMFPKSHVRLPHSHPLATDLNVEAPGHGDKIWEGTHVFGTLDYIKNLLFSVTYEGVAESYSLIFGHPGFIARPHHLSKYKPQRLSSIRNNRELSSGLLDRLNIVDVFGMGADSNVNLNFIPIEFPLQTKCLVDFQQSYELSLAQLSRFHDQMIVVGVVCKDVMMIYKTGVLICVFNGSWKYIKPWKSMLEELIKSKDIREEILNNHERLAKIYLVLVRLAFGSKPRSVILAYDTKPCDNQPFSDSMKPFAREFQEWSVLSPDNSIEENLIRASKTDGAIVL